MVTKEKLLRFVDENGYDFSIEHTFEYPTFCITIEFDDRLKIVHYNEKSKILQILGGSQESCDELEIEILSYMKYLDRDTKLEKLLN
jgi:hypothetical protein